MAAMDFVVSPSSAAKPRCSVAVKDDYWIDKYEVTNREYKEFVDAGGYLDERYWMHQFVKDGRKLSQADAAKVLGVTQPKVSALRHYKLAGFSVERLMNLLTALDQDVEIVIRQKPRSRKAGRTTSIATRCACSHRSSTRNGPPRC